MQPFHDDHGSDVLGLLTLCYNNCSNDHYRCAYFCKTGKCLIAFCVSCMGKILQSGGQMSHHLLMFKLALCF